MEFQIDFYQCVNGRLYAREFLANLKEKNPDLRVKTLACITKLKHKNYHKEPHSESFGAGLFGVRAKFGSDISRVFYCFGKGQMIYLLRGFIKKSQKTPDDEIEKARKLLKEFKESEKYYGKN